MVLFKKIQTRTKDKIPEWMNHSVIHIGSMIASVEPERKHIEKMLRDLYLEKVDEVTIQDVTNMLCEHFKIVA
jgi:hypothetical protein